jgi:hypothetical protein
LSPNINFILPLDIFPLTLPPLLPFMLVSPSLDSKHNLLTTHTLLLKHCKIVNMVIILWDVCQNPRMAFACKDNWQALLGDYIHTSS